ncbi:MAG: exodeoxyribonuclease III [candidate division Zixibacteria bacterium]|nr:exodeoxyribonuclease III [candidate division Zixibacteria bacterium]
MKTLTLLSWNVNGIRAIARKDAFGWFHEQKPDILCIQETKAQEDQIPRDFREIDGYHTYFSAAERKGYSGVGLYTKEEPRDVKHGFGINEFDSEGRTIIAEYEKFILCNIYFPNGKASKERLAYKMAFYDAFLNHIEKRRKKDTEIIICGDVNTAHKEIDLAHPKENEKVSGFLPEERAWIDKLVQQGYLDTLRMFNQEPGQYSWWDLKSRARERNVGWRIDYFLVSAGLEQNVKNAFIMPEIMGSDHCPVGIELAL